MLTVDEFIPGSLSKAEPLTLVLPRDQHETTVLVVLGEGAKTAVVLGNDSQFTSFECGDVTAWAGLMIPGVRIELDETSVFLPHRHGEPLGAMIRRGTSLTIACKGEWASQRRHVVVTDGLLPAEQDQQVGFLRWQVVLGEGAEKRVLHQMIVSVERS